MYRVHLSFEARQFYAAADRSLAKKIARCLEQLEQNPTYHPSIKALKGNFAGYYRYRVGDYRVVYLIDEEAKEVFVDAIAHRSAICEGAVYSNPYQGASQCRGEAFR